MPDSIVVGDLVIARFPTQNPQGKEQFGVRPALVVGVPQRLGNPRFPLLIVAPMTSARSQAWALASPALYPTLAEGEAGLPQNSIILLDQVRAIDLNRIVRYLGSLSFERYQPIINSFQIMFHHP